MKRRTFNLLVAWIKIGTTSLVVLGLLYTYLGTKVFTIQTIVFNGAPDQYTQKLTEEIQKSLDFPVLYFFPGDKILTYKSAYVVDAVKRVLPNTEKVKVYPKGTQTLFVEVTPYVPLYRIEGKKTLDVNGVSYIELEEKKALPQIIFGTSSPSAETLRAIVNFTPKIEKLFFPVGLVTIDNGEISLHATSSLSYVILPKDFDANKSWLSLLSALDTEPLKTMMKDKNNILEYLDLRFGNKVFYRFTKGGKEAIIPSEHATATSTQTLPR